MKTEDLDMGIITKTVIKNVATVRKHYFDACFGREDLCQQICMAVLAKAGQYDSARSKWKTYLDRIIKAEIQDYVLSRRYLKHKPMVSVDDCDHDDSPGESLGELLVYNDPPPGEPDMFEKLIYAAEQQEAIDAMPERLRDICELLKHYSATETANELGLSPNAVYREMKKIRTLFIEADLVPDHILESFGECFEKNFENFEEFSSEDEENARSTAI
jgi:RNA polymerase sigma factor (sigma-70 family)